MEIDHQEEQRRFVTTVEGRTGFLRYRPVGDDRLDLVTTWVDGELRGQGVGEALVKAALDHARREGLAVIPTCWFVGTVVKRNPEYRDLLVHR